MGAARPSCRPADMTGAPDRVVGGSGVPGACQRFRGAVRQEAVAVAVAVSDALGSVEGLEVALGSEVAPEVGVADGVTEE